MPRNRHIKNAEPQGGPTYLTWSESDPASVKAAQDETGRAYASLQPAVRHGMSRSDYEIFRPGETLPRNRAEILKACIGSYDRVSPIKNIIDMMVDFTTQGIKLVHPQPGPQEFYQNWFEHVNGLDRSQHFANNFYLMATAIVKRTMAKVSASVVDDIERGIAVDSDVYDVQPAPQPKAYKNVIPWSYDFLDPLLVNVMGGDLALFTGKPTYGFKVPIKLAQTIKSPRTADDIDLVNNLPNYILEPIQAGNSFIKLNNDRLYVAHYKKWDWQAWGNPILLSIMDDIILLQKMKLTDLAALDGAMSHIRIWKLGSLDHKLVPTQAAFAKLNELLLQSGNGQSFDLIWGPDITLEETTSDIYKYLGQEKYVPILSSMYSGLGIPPSLVGGAGGDKGFTNNSLSLKTLIERLNYGRESLIRFWNNEIKMVQQAMKFRFPAQVEFKRSILTDEAAFNALLVDLLDRDVIPVSAVREHLGFIPEVQEAVLRSEWRARDSGKNPPKAGPFHESQQDYGYKKIFAQLGVVTPSQVGVELEENKKGEKPALQTKLDSAQKLAKTKTPAGDNTIFPANPGDRKGVQFQGRPKNSLDTVPRKTKKVVPRSAAEDGSASSKFLELQLWAKDAQQTIAEIVHPVWLKACKKKNMRQLTVAETEDIERFKFALLCNLDPKQEISQGAIAALLKEPLSRHSEAEGYWKVLVQTFMSRKNATPTVDDIRQIQSYIFAMYNLERYMKPSGQNNN